MAVSHGLQFIEHGGDVPRHANLVGLGVVGLGPLYGALVRDAADGQDASGRFLTAPQCRSTRAPRLDSAGPIRAVKYRPLQARLARLSST
jgi:hypothetical protein